MKPFAAMFAFCLVATAHAQPVNLVTVDKSDRILRLHAGGEVIREYSISLGANPRGHKARQGDMRTPEGRYVLDWRNPNSRFFRSVRISYPSPDDVARAEERGFSPGGNIFIHGLPNQPEQRRVFYERLDWTDGCIAINDNEDMLEFWNLVQDGTPIHIQP